ncbi:MAG TPA: LamG-like jellyroll fold domain-containing protein [Candidatus Sulfotelmatobacter sp.]|nr:LamG-like jellyroll fold domain-containing protein [Candidatus Sulfotelmatobacter sp.]
MNSKPLNTRSVCAAAIMVLLALMPGIVRAQQSAYFNAINNLSPVGYWPMHEMETPASGDIETNYGSEGLLGTGYYPDWSSANGNIIVRQAPGALVDDPDTSVFFAKEITSGSSVSFVNALVVPHTSPQSTLNPPFSIECWYYPTNTAAQDVCGQNGFEGLNAGSEGAGAGAICGLRFTFGGGSQNFVIYGFDNSTTLNSLVSSSAETVSNWYYVVLTCDVNTNFALFVNGNPVSTAAGVGKYSPDYWTPLTIGSGRGGTRAIAGFLDEFAVYTNVIPDISTHYLDGTNGPDGAYFHAVTNDNPVIYLRMDAANYTAPAIGTWPVLYNYGTTNGVAVGNGVYTPGTLPGILTNSPVNLNGVPFGGVSNSLAGLSGVSSFGDAGYAPAFNPTGSNANFTVTALFRGNPCDSRVQSIVGRGTNSWQLGMTTTGTLVFNAGNGNKAAGGTGASAGDISTRGVYNDGNWHEVVAVNQTNVISIYVDGTLDTNGTPSGIATTNLIAGNTQHVMIGSDPIYTNNPAGVGRNFAGQICEVAFFTNALTATQVQTLYNASGVAPTIRVQPQSYSVNAGTVFTNMAVLVNGSDPLSFQWYTNGVALVGQTASNLFLNPVTANEANSDYYVIVTNSYGSVTSAVASLTVYSSPLFTESLPETYTNSNDTNYMVLYTGVNPAFKVMAAGAQPIVYYWYTNGVNVAAGQNSTNFALANVQVGTINVACVASNFVGTNTIVWSASVIADPLNGSSSGPAPYPQQVLAGNPIGYWRMNDYGLDGDNINGDDGYVAHDYAGGNDGVYTNVYLNNGGYSSTDPSDTSVQLGDFGNSFPNTANNLAYGIEGIDFATANGSNAEFTVEAWAQGVEDQQSDPGAIVTQGKYGVSDAFNLGLDSNSAHHYQFYVRSAAGTEYAADSSIAPDGNWHHLAGVCDEANGVISLYVDGHLQSTNAIPKASGLFEANAPVSIGAGTADGANYAYQFLGNLNDIAVFDYALTASNVASQFVSLGSAPVVSPAPQATADVNGGGTLVIPAIAVGTPKSGYYWTDENAGTNVAAGTSTGAYLNATLTVSNVPGSWSGDTLQLTVTNAYGQNTYSVVLTINTNAPIITLQLPSPVTVVQGNSYTYSVGADGVTPLAYQWYNGSSAVSGATNASYTVTAGAPGNTTYSVTVSNQFGGLASADSQFISISSTRPTLTSGFETNLMLLKPAGYWPMHEVQSPAAGDIEVNYGSLGLLGEAFYPDWTLDSSTNAFARQFGGALVYDPDSALHFTTLISSGSGAGTWTNELYVPHTSPLATLIPPFTVECWFYPTNSGGGSSAQSVWGQHGFEALNDGYAGNGDGPYKGIQLNYNGSFQVYVYSNGTQLVTASSTNAAINQWHHVVAVCDIDTNITFYLDGVASTPVAAAGQYMPDYWTPLTIGGTRGGTRACAGTIDEFAVYTNVITDVSTHYQDAFSGGPGKYFSDVQNDRPLIYLRMDAPSYTEPPTNTWPVLFNYGSAGTNGIYTPGTAPGVVSGPALAGLAGANVAQLSGVSSFADAGYAASFNPTGSNANFSVAATFRGNPCDNRVQTIVGHGNNSWQLSVTTNGCVVFNAGNGNSTTDGTGQSAGDIRTMGVYNDGNWHQVAAVNQGNVISIYVDGKLDTNGTPSGITATNVIPGNLSDLIIGSDPSNIINPEGVGRQFAGQICDVALFTNALNAGEVSALYAAATNPSAVPAFVAPEPPLSVIVAPGAALNLTAGAAGTSNVGYTWQINTNGGGSSVLSTGAGAAPLNANLSVGSVPSAWNGGQLELTVTNAYGTNSAYVNLAVVNPVSTVPPVIGFAFANGNLTLSWPPDHLGWMLEAQTNSLTVGLSNDWTQVAGSAGLTNITIPINLSNGTVFYRLIYP